ncbi:MAG: TniQ family protein [Waterburya sp.]
MQDNQNQFKKYTSLQLIPANDNQPSKLYSVAPINIGRPLVESLTSYISRLALAHCVYPGILMERIIKQVIDKKHSSADLHNLYGFTSAINGTGVMGSDIVSGLEKLTLQKQLALLTLANLSELIPSRKLFNEHRKWCPQCFENWKVQNEELYEPLLWKIQAVEICSIHNSALQEKCLFCNRHNYHLAWKTRPGYCSQCDRWLGTVDKHKTLLHDKELNWYLWINKNLGELLSKNSVEDFSWSKKTISRQGLKSSGM